MKNLSKRSTELEHLDTQPFSFEAFHAYLRELERVNQWTFAYRPIRHWLKKALPSIKTLRPISILDVGSGYGDTLRHISKWAQRRGLDVALVGVDLNPWAQKVAEAATPVGLSLQYKTADVFHFDPGEPFDFITCSLFTHHLTDEENVRFLRWMEVHSSRGWFINDLHRHPLPYAFIKYAARILRLNPWVRYDAPLSVARSFTAADWTHLLHEAKIPLSEVRIDWFFPFRYSVTRSKP